MKRVLVSMTYSFLWLISLLPLRLLYLFSDIIWIVMFLCPPLRYRRNVVRKNLRTSFPDKGVKELKRIERRFYRQFLDQIFEMFKSASMPGWWMRRHMRFEGTDILEKEFSQGRSIVMYLGHTGNWEWISSLPLNLDGNAVCCQVYHPLENAVTDSIMLKLRSRYGAESIAMKHVLRTLLGYRKAGKQFVVGMIADQVPLWWDIHYWTDFLNHNTPVLSGSEQIIRKMDLCACYGHISRPRRGHYVLKVVPMFSRAEGIEEFGITEKYFRLLEDNIRETPELWLWSHNRWKRTWEGYQKWLKTRLRSNKRDSEKE
ncbi:MAG: lysophospholipid acyltransferase family protein [Bacteroidaceae bacterium]|nr:lysophospholipid acyltransferase family protein [Bacteroidaceae bacterium]